MTKRKRIIGNRRKAKTFSSEFWAVGGSHGRKDFEIASNRAIDFIKQWNEKFLQSSELSKAILDGKLFRQGRRRKKHKNNL